MTATPPAIPPAAFVRAAFAAAFAALSVLGLVHAVADPGPALAGFVPPLVARAIDDLVSLAIGFSLFYAILARRKRRAVPAPQTAPVEAALAPIEPTTTPEMQAIIDKARQIAEELDNYHFFTELLRRQVEVIINMSEGAANEIFNNLSDVDQAMGELLSFIDQSGSNDSVAAIIGHAENQLAANREVIRQFERQRADARRDSEKDQKNIRETAQSLASMIQDVRGIAHQTNMLSFNATIEAARAGNAGRGFAVVAAEVKALSRESDRAAQNIHSGIEALQRIVTTSLEAIVHDRADREDETFAEINRTVAHLAENLELLISHQRDVLTKVHTENLRIAEPIKELMASIQFQDIIRQQLNSLTTTSAMVDEHIESVRRVLGNLSDDLNIHSLSEKLKDTYDRYVMAQQRNAHLQAEGSDATEAEGLRIELF